MLCKRGEGQERVRCMLQGLLAVEAGDSGKGGAIKGPLGASSTHTGLWCERSVEIILGQQHWRARQRCCSTIDRLHVPHLPSSPRDPHSRSSLPTGAAVAKVTMMMMLLHVLWQGHGCLPAMTQSISNPLLLVSLLNAALACARRLASSWPTCQRRTAR